MSLCKAKHRFSVMETLVAM